MEVNSGKDRTCDTHRATPGYPKEISGWYVRCLPPEWVGRGCAVSRLAWTDPAPREVHRPRLPWWTLLPRKLFLVASPIIAVMVVVTVVVFVARRVWRYPLCVIGGAVLAGLGLGYSWWAPVWLGAGLAGVGGVWAWAHPDSFDRIAARQVRSEWRRAVIYAWPWK